MLYHSTKGKSGAVSLKEAVIRGLAEDGGLYMPVSLPVMPDRFFESIHRLSFDEIAFEVAGAFLKDDIPSKILREIINESFDFPLPLVNVEQNVYSLELFHGPTMAFKDIGARFMSRLLSYLYKDEKFSLNVIVATSGDTGSAVAAGFYGAEGINVFVLFPGGKVSRLQQKQITTWGGNIYPIEVDGTFDDCQKLAKQILGDKQINESLPVTSANSINIGRLIPQSFYYFYAFSRLYGSGIPVVFSVPSGNLGNLTGGLLARAAGLPVLKFIAAANINDVFPKFIESGTYKPSPPKKSMSNAMDVGDPSNFARLEMLMGHSIKNFRESVTSWSFSDHDTAGAIKKIYSDSGYIMDPHGAVGYLGLKRYMEMCDREVNGIFLETAHPAKFPETLKQIIESFEDLPPQLKGVLDKEERFHSAGNDPLELMEYILKVNG